MKKWLLVLSLVGASGCACPTFDGLDETLSYRSCTSPDVLVQRSSEWTVAIDGYEEGTEATWVSEDLAILSATGDTEQAVLRAWEVGSAEVTSTLADGTADRFVYEVARADSGVLIDAITEFVIDQQASDENPLVGDLPTEPVGDVVRLFEGQTLGLNLDLFAGGERVQWTPSALTGEGSVRVDDEEPIVRLATSEVGRVLDDAEEQLVEVSVISVDGIESGDLALGAYPQARDELSADATSATLAHLRAVVTDGDDRIWQAPVLWEVVAGPGEVLDFRAAGWGDSMARTDAAQVTLGESELGRWETAKTCVAASIETRSGAIVARSVWITPDGAELYDNGVCGNRGCSCSTVEPAGASALGLVLAAAVLRRRRRSSGP